MRITTKHKTTSNNNTHDTNNKDNYYDAIRTMCSGRLADKMESQEGGRVLLTEILLPRIARQGTVCMISIRG